MTAVTSSNFFTRSLIIIAELLSGSNKSSGFCGLSLMFDFAKIFYHLFFRIISITESYSLIYTQIDDEFYTFMDRIDLFIKHLG